MAGPTGNIANPFVDAPILVREIKDHVTTQQLGAIENANDARDKAMSAIESIARSFPSLHLGGLTAPLPPAFPVPGRTNIDLPELGTDSFGKISSTTTGTFTPGQVSAVPDMDIADFNPVFDNLNIPDAPTPRPDPVFPDAPVLRPVDLPDKPLIQRPLLPDLVDLVVPAFTFRQLDPYNDDNPAFVGSAVSGVLQWVETVYEPVLLDEEVAVLRRMWAGGTGLPPAVEQALWERAASREDVAIARDISAAATEFAGRGFSLPPGMLVNRIDAIRTDGQLKKQTLGREVLIKVADTHIENLRFACTQAIAAENVLIGLWSQMAQRQFDAAKIQLDSELALLNAQVAIFNALQGARSNTASIRRLALEERALELQEFKAQLDGEIAKGQINDQRLKAFLGQYEGVKADIEVYKSEVQGAQLESELQRNEVENYKTGVQATAETISADKLRYEAYESRVKGETAKAGLLESQARGYSAYVSGKAARADISIKNQQAELAQMDLGLRAYMAQLERDKVRLQAESAAISANADAHRANTARYTAQVGAETAIAELQNKAYEAQIRSNIALYEVEMRKHMADMEQLMRAASLQADGLKAIGQMYSTLAAGAMAGVSISSSIGADAKTSASGSTSVEHKV